MVSNVLSDQVGVGCTLLSDCKLRSEICHFIIQLSLSAWLVSSIFALKLYIVS